MRAVNESYRAVAYLLADATKADGLGLHDEANQIRAAAAVVADVHLSYPDMTVGEAIAHVRNTVNLEDVVDDDELGEAYRLVLKEEEQP